MDIVTFSETIFSQLEPWQKQLLEHEVLKMSLKDRTAELDGAIAATIKSIRVARGMSQTAVADALGITFQQIQKYENGKNRVASSTLVLIGKALDTPAAEILSLAEKLTGDPA